MKSFQIASGLVSLLAVIGAAGCGAEQGSEPAQTGQTNSSLTVTTLASATYDFPGTLREFPGSCTIKDKDNIELMVVAGGFNSSGNALNDIYFLRQGTVWSQAKDSGSANVNLATSRGRLVGIQDPNDVHSCWFFSGSTTLASGSALAAAGNNLTEKLTIDNANHWSISHLSGMTEYAELPRIKFQLRACAGTSKIIEFGGIDDTGAYTNTIKTFDTSSPTTAWVAAGTMGASRADFGLAQDGANFVVGAGQLSGSVDSHIDLIKTTSCASPDVVTLASTLTTSREGNVVVYRGHDGDGKSMFAVAVGRDGSANALSSAQEFTVDWSGTHPALKTGTSLVSEGSSAAVGAATYLPMFTQFVQSGSSNPTSLLIGGTNGSPEKDTFASNGVQETYWAQQSLASNGRVHGAAEFVGGKVEVAVGVELTSTGPTKTFLARTEEIQP
jgi:hypothetical protein